jgi:hypothetical protein
MGGSAGGAAFPMARLPSMVSDASIGANASVIEPELFTTTGVWLDV